MADTNIMLLSLAQQRTYVDAIFAMAALDGFELIGDEGDDRPVVCAKQLGKYTVEISWIDEDDVGPDATKAVWAIEVSEGDPDGGERNIQVMHIALHATDALRIAKGLVRFYHALTQRSPADSVLGAAANTPRMAGERRDGSHIG